MHYLALCCIVKDEAPILKECVSFHSLLGVEHFYVYDNMSKIPVSKILRDYVPDSRLTVRRIEGSPAQMPAYEDCLRNFGPQCRWLGFLDIDEFLVPLKDSDLRAMLSEFEEYAGLVVPWRTFSSNGHLKRPPEGVIAGYSRRIVTDIADNIHCKSLVDPSRTIKPNTPHGFLYKAGEYHVNEEHMPLPWDSSFTWYSGKLAQINHYFYRSQQDFCEKIQRGRADIHEERPRPMETFYAHTSWETVEDRTAIRFLPALRRALDASVLPESQNFCLSEEEHDTQNYLNAAMRHLNSGALDKAAVCLCHAGLAEPDHGGIQVMRATIARRAGDPDRAERLLRRAMRLANLPLAFQELAEIRTAQNRPEAAEELKRFLQHYKQLMVTQKPPQKQ